MKKQFRLTVGLMLVNIFVVVGTYFRLWNLRIPIGSFSLQHWFAIIGGAYLIIFVGLFIYLKRRDVVRIGTLMKVHVFGNLVAFIFISAHFGQQMGRPAASAPDLGTGLSTYLILLILVGTGFMMRFGLLKRRRETWHLLHLGISLSLFIVVVIHALRNFGIL